MGISTAYFFYDSFSVFICNRAISTAYATASTTTYTTTHTTSTAVAVAVAVQFMNFITIQF